MVPAPPSAGSPDSPPPPSNDDRLWLTWPSCVVARVSFSWLAALERRRLDRDGLAPGEADATGELAGRRGWAPVRRRQIT